MNATPAPRPASAAEQQRLQCLRTLQILDTPPDPALDALTRELAAQLRCPIGLVSLIDEQRQWFKSRHGMAAAETPRDWAFCAHTIASEEMLVVNDASMDARFRTNPLVTGEPHIRFYAGARLMVHGQAIGTLCAIDTRPRVLSPSERDTLQNLAQVAQACITRAAEQQRLALREAQLADMVRATSDFLWEVDAQLRFVWLSDEAQAVLGVAAAALVGQPLWNPPLLDPMGEPLPEGTTLHQCLVAQASTLQVMVSLPLGQKPSTTMRSMLLSAVAVIGADGARVGWRGTAKDVGQWLEGARRSRELESRLSKIASQVPGMIFLLEQWPSGELRLPYTSQGLRDQFGLAPMALRDDARVLLARVPRHERAALLESMQTAGRNRSTWSFEFSLEAGDGSLRWIGGSATPQPRPDGGLFWHGFAADITERRAAAALIDRMQLRLQRALRVGGLGVVEVDLGAGRLDCDNQAGSLHGLPDSADGHGAHALTDWLAVIDEVDQVGLRQALVTVQSQATPLRLTYRLDGGDETRRVELQLERTEVPGRLVGLCRDVTEHERLERAQRQQAAAETARLQQTEFLSRVSHELRTPMNAILGFVELLRSDTKAVLAPHQRQWTQHVMTAGEHLMALINDLLDLTQSESGHHAMDPRDWPLADLLNNCLALLQPIADRQQVWLAPPTGATATRVRADHRALEQVLLNVIGNAIKYNRRAGRVAIDVATTASRCTITVSDEGSGIAPEYRDKLFQPFERLGRRQGVEEGSGLGLAITKRLVEAMQGGITAHFPPHCGTAFVIEIPLAPASPGVLLTDERQGVAATPPPAAPVGGPKRCAVYAEDNPVNAMLLQAMFELRNDWSLQIVSTGSELLAAVACQHYDLVLLDMHLGSESGMDVMRALRSDAATSALNCVALSADGQPENIATALRAGFDDYWTKPIDLNLLNRRLDLLAQKPVRDGGTVLSLQRG